MLVPEIAQGASPELEPLRAACLEAIGRLCAAEPSAVLVLGAGPETRRYPASSFGDFGRFGAADLRVGLGRHNCAGASKMPLPLLVGAWLLGESTRQAAAPSGRDTLRLGAAVAVDSAPEACAALGRRLVDDSESRVGLLVMGDGSARRTDKAPGHHDGRAAGFDEGVAAALAAADTDALSRLDPDLAVELMAAGRAPWQVLAGAADGRAWRSELLYADAPYGVGYFVASWAM